MFVDTAQLSRYDTWELDTMVQQIERPSTWLLRTFFPRPVYFTTAAIEFDVLDRSGRRLAPFVSPLAPGKAMVREGYRTKQLKPAYIKPLDLLVPQEGTVRRPGEAYGGTLTAMQRFDDLVRETLDNHDMMIDNRLEWMAASALVNGSITISGDQYQTTVVNFGRDASLSVALTGASKWSLATSNPLTDIETAALNTRLISKGAVVDTLIMDGLTWNLLRQHAAIQDEINIFNRNYLPGQQPTSIDKGPRNNTNTGEGQLVGLLAGRFNIYIYDAYYDDNAGMSQPYLPPYTVLGMSSQIQGAQYYGAIQDLDAGMVATRMFAKSKVKFNPSALELLSQSAPLVAPKRPNAMFKLTVN